MSQTISSSKAFLGTEPLGRLMVRLALPNVVAQLVNLLYNVVDRVFIGHIPGVGADALTGVGVCLPLIMLVSSFAAFAGAGGAPLASIALGNGDDERARRILRNVIWLLIAFAAVLLAVFYLFGSAMLSLFGASANTLPYAWSYFSIYMAGTPFVMIYLGLSPFLLAQGDSRFALVAVVTGALVNLALDPLLIFGAGMGVAGAAVASVIAQAASAALVVAMLARCGSVFRMRLRLGRPDGSLVRQVLALGGAPFFMQASESAMIIVLNSQLQAFGGDVHVGTLTVLQSILQLIFVPKSGFTQGVQPIVSYCYGARLFDRVKATAKRMIAVTFTFAVVAVVLVALFPEALARLFTDDPEIVALVGQTAPVFVAGMGLMGLQTSMQSVFTGLGAARLALTVATVRKIVLLIPLALILPNFLGAWGVYVAEPISDTVSATFCTVLFLVSIRTLLSDRARSKVV